MDVAELGEVFSPDFAHDPYSMFVAIMREATTNALIYEGNMSEQELNTIKAVGAVMDAADPLWR